MSKLSEGNQMGTKYMMVTIMHMLMMNLTSEHISSDSEQGPHVT